MTLSQKRRHFSRMISELVLWGFENGYDVAYDGVKRTIEQQRLYVQSGASKTLKSKHLEGLAADLVLYKGTAYLRATAQYQPLGEKWKSMDSANAWGGDWPSFKDGGHFEYNG